MFRASLSLAVFVLCGTTQSAPVLNSHFSLNECLSRNLQQVTFQQDQQYDDERKSHNLRKSILPNPVAIVRATSEDEVARSILCAKSYGVLACARNGKHGWENAAGCTNGIVVDLANLNQITINNQEETVTFQGGATNGEVYFALGMNTPAWVAPLGMNSPVGASGLVLGGGRGPLTSLYGLAIDSLIEVEFIDHEGNLRIANEGTNTDLFWLVRGGGGGVFPGIVTKFTMKVYPVPNTITKFVLSYPRNIAPQVIESWCRHQGSFDRRMFSQIILWGRSPQRDNDNINIQGYMFGGNDADVRNILSPVTNQLGGTPNTNNMQWLQVIALESGDFGNNINLITNRDLGYGHNIAVKSTSIVGYKKFDISDGTTLMNFLNENGLRNGSPEYGKYTSMYGVAGTANDVPSDATAYGHRGAEYILLFLSQYNAEQPNTEQLLLDHHTRMSTEMMRRLNVAGREQAGSWFSYPDNDLPGAEDDIQKQLRAYFGSNLDRILRVRWENDPSGVFGINELPLPRPDGITPAPILTQTPQPQPADVPTTPQPVAPTPQPSTVAPCNPGYPTTCLDQGNCYLDINQCQSSGCRNCVSP